MKKSIIRSIALLTVTAFWLISILSQAQNAWINEIHYDNVGADVNEAVEVVIENPGSYDLSNFAITLFHENGYSYYTIGLNSFQVGSTYGDYTVYYVYFPTIPGMHDGPDAVCLSYFIYLNSQFLSYEGVIMAQEGDIGGEDSWDIGVAEDPSTPVGYSLQLGGTGMAYADFSWQQAGPSTIGTLNNNQLLDFQVGGIGIGTSSPNSSALLDIHSQTKGILIPRLTSARRNEISNPVAGLLVYQTDGQPGYYYYTGSDWVGLTGIGQGAISPNTCIDYDGNAYPTIQIGNQVWMAENLRVTHYNNGDDIPEVTDDGAWYNLNTGAYCWYDNDQTSNGKYGALYNINAVNDSRGLCPAGWHEPTDEEWITLTTYLGGDSFAGGKMKSVSALWNSPNIDATNNSGFSGLPGGGRDFFGDFYDLGWMGAWWTSTESEYNAGFFKARYLSYPYSQFFSGVEAGISGLSVRCLRD